MIGQAVSTESLFPLLRDLSLSNPRLILALPTGPPDCINILYGTYRDVKCCVTQTPPCRLSRFQNLLESSS